MKRYSILAGFATLVVAAVAAAETPADTLRVGVDGAVRLALRDGVEAAMARQDVVAAESGVGVALSYGLPEINLSATYTRNLKKPVIFFELEKGNTQSFEIGQDNAYQGALTLRQALWASGRVRRGYDMAKTRAEGARLAGDDAAAGIARDVKTAYYLALLAKEQTTIAQRSLEQAERDVNQIASRVREGVTPEFDKLRTEVTLANRRPQLTRAENAETIAMESLKRLMGVPLDRPLVLTSELSYEPFDLPREEVVKKALETRSDLAAVRKEAEASEHQLAAQSADDRPLLYLDGTLAWQGETSNGFFPGDKERAESASVGLSLVWPILDGFRNKNKTQQARAAMEKARLAVRQYEDIVKLEVRSHWGDVQSIAEEIAGAERAVAVAGEAYDIAKVRYDTGLSTLIEYLDADLALVQARLNLSETLYRYNVALAGLSYSIGEGPRLQTVPGDH